MTDFDAVKYVGTDTQTDEEWARRERTAELLAPLVEQERLAAITTLDALIKEQG